MAERPSPAVLATRPPAQPPASADAPASRRPLWFLADRDAFLRRFVLRTLLRPPRFRRGPLPRALER